MIVTVLKGAFTLFWILDPLGNIPIYLSLIKGLEATDVRRTIHIATAFAIFIFALFTFFGHFIFHYLNFRLEHIMIAGGMLLVLLGVDMMFGQEREVKDYRDIALVPLGMPLMSGPGSIATMLLILATSGIYVALASLAVALFAQYFIYIGARGVMRLAGKNSLKLMSYLAALIAASFGIEMIIRGLSLLE